MPWPVALCEGVHVSPASSPVEKLDTGSGTCASHFPAPVLPKPFPLWYLSLQPLTPRQMRMVTGESPDMVCNSAGNGTIREADAPYHFDSKDGRKAQAERLQK